MKRSYYATCMFSDGGHAEFEYESEHRNGSADNLRDLLWALRSKYGTFMADRLYRASTTLYDHFANRPIGRSTASYTEDDIAHILYD